MSKTFIQPYKIKPSPSWPVLVLVPGCVYQDLSSAKQSFNLNRWLQKGDFIFGWSRHIRGGMAAEIIEPNTPVTVLSGTEDVTRDFLWLHLRSLPYFRSLLRAVEARFYQGITLPRPILDLGCGDGHFASVTMNEVVDVGLDPWRGPIREAAGWGCYQTLVQADGSAMPFPDGYFASAFSNSVLEHIPHLEAVLIELARVLKPGARFVFCVPNDRFLSTLSIGRTLDRLGIRSFGNAYRSFFNRISRHHHCDPPQVWKARLEQVGFTIERWWHYFSPQALKVMEWGHYFGLPSLVSRWLTGRWILIPQRWNLALTYRLVKPYYEENPIRDDGAYTFYIARKHT